MTQFSDLIGKTISKIEASEGDEIVNIWTTDGLCYEMSHSQDCCERVDVQDICGSLEDLVGSPIVRAEERTSTDEPYPTGDDSNTWTFYELATNKGSVTIRWLGSSNGYYSESVDFYQVQK